MSKLILCSGEMAKQPFYIKLTDTYIYSIEELCYYLYNNIYIVTEDIFDDNLVTWLKEQLHMDMISNKLSQLIENNNSLKDIVVSILCSADYYTETEIKDLIQVMDDINHRTPKAKQKIKADNYLKYHNFSKAAKEYDVLLKGEFCKDISAEEYGDILHNMAIVQIHIATYKEAAILFKEAYSRNQRVESLRQYLFALKLAKAEEEYYSELLNIPESEALSEYIEKEIERVNIEALNSKEYLVLESLSAKKTDGHVNEYYQAIDNFISKWKHNYINEVM